MCVWDSKHEIPELPLSMDKVNAFDTDDWTLLNVAPDLKPCCPTNSMTAGLAARSQLRRGKQIHPKHSPVLIQQQVPWSRSWKSPNLAEAKCSTHFWRSRLDKYQEMWWPWWPVQKQNSLCTSDLPLQKQKEALAFRPPEQRSVEQDFSHLLISNSACACASVQGQCTAYLCTATHEGVENRKKKSWTLKKALSRYGYVICLGKIPANHPIIQPSYSNWENPQWPKQMLLLMDDDTQATSLAPQEAIHAWRTRDPRSNRGHRNRPKGMGDARNLEYPCYLYVCLHRSSAYCKPWKPLQYNQYYQYCQNWVHPFKYAEECLKHASQCEYVNIYW